MDKGAAEKLASAAASVGLTVDQLVDLVSDSGLRALPPPDGATQLLSLKDLGERLHKLSCAEPPDKRAEWFSALVPTQQKALLTVLRERGYATAVIAQDYGIDPMRVVEAYNEFADNLGKHVTQVRLSTIVGQMQLAAERAMQGAAESKDWNGFWRIEKDVVTLLQSMGVVDKAAQRVEHVNIGVEEKREELLKILEVERMGEKRQREISQQEREYDVLEEGEEDCDFRATPQRGDGDDSPAEVGELRASGAGVAGADEGAQPGTGEGPGKDRPGGDGGVAGEDSGAGGLPSGHDGQDRPDREGGR